MRMLGLFMKALKALGWYLLGFLVVPVLDILTLRSEMMRWRFLDHIYGNRIDGIDGDDAYRENESHVPVSFVRVGLLAVGLQSAER